MRVLATEDESLPDRHPRHGRPLLLPRLGYEQQRLIPQLAQLGAQLTTAPMYYLGANPELALFPRDRDPLGLVLDPCMHLRQLPFDRRAPSFRALGFGNDPDPFDPDNAHLTDEEIGQLGRAPIDIARPHGATLFLTGFHLTGAVGSRGRDLDLALASAGIEHFRAQHMHEPPPLAANPLPREIYAVICVDLALLKSVQARARLVDAYEDLAPDGYWVKIHGFDERASRAGIRAGAAFLAELDATGRPVVSCGPGHLAVGLLVNNVSVSIGMAEGERFRFPADWSARDDDRSGRGRLRTIYHPRYLRSFRARGDGAMRAFANSRCRCGRHIGDHPPERGEIESHAAFVRMVEAREALVEEDVADRREWLLATAAMASHLAHDAGVDYTPSVVFESVFDGFDSFGDERRERAVS